MQTITKNKKELSKIFVVVAVLDELTCDNCRPRHGKRIGVTSQTKFADVPSWRDCISEAGCRCTMVNGVQDTAALRS